MRQRQPQGTPGCFSFGATDAPHTACLCLLAILRRSRHVCTMYVRFTYFSLFMSWVYACKTDNSLIFSFALYVHGRKTNAGFQTFFILVACSICSTSLYPGNQVEGLPRATRHDFIALQSHDLAALHFSSMLPVQDALRVPPAVTRLTVYHGLSLAWLCTFATERLCNFTTLRFCNFASLPFYDFLILRFCWFAVSRFHAFGLLRFRGFGVSRFCDFAILPFRIFAISQFLRFLRFRGFSISRFCDFAILQFLRFRGFSNSRFHAFAISRF